MDRTNDLNSTLNSIRFNLSDYYFILGENYRCYFFDIKNNLKLTEIREITIKNNQIIFKKNSTCEFANLFVNTHINNLTLHNEIRPYPKGLWKMEYKEDINNISIISHQNG
jgi:hypothetical protein